MKTEQFKQLQAICMIYGLCFSLHLTVDELVEYELPDEITDAADELRRALKSFHNTVEGYVIAHKDTYIDKEESDNEKDNH